VSITPDELLGRLGSTARTVTLSLQPLGFLAAGARSTPATEV
jgi:hypothetical protein